MDVPTIHALPVLNELNYCIENMHENTNYHMIQSQRLGKKKFQIVDICTVSASRFILQLQY